METLSKFFSQLWEFIKTYNVSKILELIHSINWIELAKSPITWAVAAVVLAVIVLTKRYRYIIVALSVVAFAFLVDKTLPTQLENVELKNILGFFTGTVAIVAIDFYLLFVKE
ncbi:MAG: hypothetical protein ACP5TY_03885 [Thermodesulforhabdaceae bacterium]